MKIVSGNGRRGGVQRVTEAIRKKKGWAMACIKKGVKSNAQQKENAESGRRGGV